MSCAKKTTCPYLCTQATAATITQTQTAFCPCLIYTELTVIGAHFGGWSIWEEASKKLCGTPNLYVDCSSAFPYLKKETAKEIIRRYGADRVLFGSDYPMWSPEKELEYFLSLNLDENEIKSILNINTCKIFNLE